ncbi:MAG: chorismate-binding protein [Terriglobales bacterium]
MAEPAETARWEWRLGESGDPARLLQDFLVSQGLPADRLSLLSPAYTATLPHSRRYRRACLLVSAAGGAAISGVASDSTLATMSSRNPTPSIPDVVAVVYDGSGPNIRPEFHPHPGDDQLELGDWTWSWREIDHAVAVERTREAIAAGELYQANIVGHAQAGYRGNPSTALGHIAGLPGATHAQVITGRGWAVAMASPETLVSVAHGRVRTYPIKGTRPRTEAGRRELMTSVKERAEHIMIVDMARNDLSQVAQLGSVDVEDLFTPKPWCDLWQAESTVAARIRPQVGLAALLRALCPAASVTGAPKRAAVRLFSELEPVGRGPSMGTMGWLTPAGLRLGVTIRTVAVTDGSFHVWAGGGITWGSDSTAEVSEALAKSQPIRTALYHFAKNRVTMTHHVVVEAPPRPQ